MKTSRDLVPGFGVRVREERERQGWSQGELAERAGTHLQTVSNVEREYRAVSLRLARDLAKALGVTLDALLPVDDPPTESAPPPVKPARTRRKSDPPTPGGI